MEANNKINDIQAIIEDVNAPLPEPEQVVEKTTTTSHLKIGEIYKITGGKYKKFKTCILQKINETYSDVQVKEDFPPASPHNGATKQVKVKNVYLLRQDPPGWDMPEQEQLNVVEDLDKYLKDNPDEKFHGTPEINDMGEVVDNITDVLPNIEEALNLREENQSLKATIAQQELIKKLDTTPLAPEITWTSAQVTAIVELVVVAIKLSQ